MRIGWLMLRVRLWLLQLSVGFKNRSTMIDRACGKQYGISVAGQNERPRGGRKGGLKNECPEHFQHRQRREGEWKLGNRKNENENEDENENENEDLRSQRLKIRNRIKRLHRSADRREEERILVLGVLRYLQLSGEHLQGLSQTLATPTRKVGGM